MDCRRTRAALPANDYISVQCVLGRVRETLQRGPFLNPLRVLLKRDLIERVYIPKGPLILPLV